MKRTLFLSLMISGFIILAAGCAGTTPREGLPQTETGTTEKKQAPAALDGSAGLSEIGKQAADSLLQLLPIDSYERIAVGWDAGTPYMNAIGDALSARWPKATPLSDLGVNAGDRQEAINQLDPTSFAALLWLAPDPYREGKLFGLHVYLMPTGPGSFAEMLFTVEPPADAAGVRPEVRETPAIESRWIKLNEKPVAIGWENSSDHLWISFKNSIGVYKLDDWTNVATFNLPEPAEGQTAGPSVLREVTEDTGLSSMGWFDLGRRSGRLYVNSAEGVPQPAGILEGFPLNTRESRFLKAEEDKVEKAFSLSNFRDEELGLCVDIVRFKGDAGTLFAFLQQNGSIGVVEGQTLSVVNGPITKQASAITAIGDILIVASDSDTEGFTITSDYIWRKRWSLKVSAEKIFCLAVGKLDEKYILLVGARKGEENGILVTDIPKEDKSTQNNLSKKKHKGKICILNQTTGLLNQKEEL